MISPELQYRMLDALRVLDFEGAQLVGASTHAMIHFGNGVPKILLRAWLDLIPATLNKAIKVTLRMGFVTVQTGDLFQTMLPWGFPVQDRTQAKMMFARPDGKVVLIRWEPVAPRGFAVEAGCGDLEADGKISTNLLFFTLKMNSTEQLIRISGDGLKWLDGTSEYMPALDDLVTLSQVAPLAGRGKRTLERYLRDGKLPEPDVPGGNGAPHRWYWRTIRPALEKMGRRILPARFPASQII